MSSESESIRCHEPWLIWTSAANRVFIYRFCLSNENLFEINFKKSFYFCYKKQQKISRFVKNLFIFCFSVGRGETEESFFNKSNGYSFDFHVSNTRPHCLWPVSDRTAPTDRSIGFLVASESSKTNVWEEKSSDNCDNFNDWSPHMSIISANLCPKVRSNSLLELAEYNSC